MIWPSSVIVDPSDREWYINTDSGQRYRRVSAVIESNHGMPWLKRWYAKLERLDVMAKAINVYRDASARQLQPAQFERLLSLSLNPKYAAEDESQKALDIGSEAHALCEWHVRSQMLGPGERQLARPKSRPESEHAFTEFASWYQGQDIEPLATEETVWDDEWGTAGTYDFRGRKRSTGGIILWDYKTSKSLSWTYRVQVGGFYKHMVEKRHNCKVEAAYIVMIPKYSNMRFRVSSVLDPVKGLPITFDMLHDAARHMTALDAVARALDEGEPVWNVHPEQGIAKAASS